MKAQPQKGRKGGDRMLAVLQNMDAAALLWIQDNLRAAFLNPIVCIYTQLGDLGSMWIILSILMLLHPKTRRAGFTALVALLVGLLCTNVVLKHLVSRPRPYVTLSALTPLLIYTDPNSFPSGHTCAAFAAAGAWFRTLPRKWMRITGIVLAVLMAFSRLYVGVHYPLDVLAGAAIGLLSAFCALRIVRTGERRLEARQKNRQKK